jgi:hypothetical protein
MRRALGAFLPMLGHRGPWEGRRDRRQGNPNYTKKGRFARFARLSIGMRQARGYPREGVRHRIASVTLT